MKIRRHLKSYLRLENRFYLVMLRSKHWSIGTRRAYLEDIYESLDFKFYALRMDYYAFIDSLLQLFKSVKKKNNLTLIH